MDINCPYCGEGQEIFHDDGYGYEEDKTFEQQCCDCEKTFAYTTSIHYYHEAKQAPCMNGEPHGLVKSTIYPDIFKNARHCVFCDFEDREIDEEKRKAFFDGLAEQSIRGGQ